MADRPSLDLLIKNVRVVRPRHDAPETRDLGIADGRFTRVEPAIDTAQAREVFDARGQLAFPGVAQVFPHLDVRREVTVGHLLLDCDAPTGVLAKVNPPIRPREDVEFLWQALLARRLVAPGYDANLALLDPARRFTVRAADSPSGQGYTPFEGQELTGRVTATFLRGSLVYDGQRVVGPARGRYLSRPDSSPSRAAR